MPYLWQYQTPAQFDDLCLSSDGRSLTGLWFEGSRSAKKLASCGEVKDLPIFRQTCQWLDLYFAGQIPDFIPKYSLKRATPFQREVLALMAKIPYGQTTTYGALTQGIMQQHQTSRMSPQAIGGAVGSNPICIILPCHRVIGKNGNLVGFSGGINNKIELLKLEGITLAL